MSLPLLTTPATWAASARCAQVDPELFYPGPGHDTAARDAVAICAECPVRLQCLDAALAYESQPDVGAYGIWGGLTARERDALRGRRVNLPCPDCRTPTPKDMSGRAALCGLCRHHRCRETRQDDTRRTA